MSEQQYEVFLSFKNLGQDGRPTPDAALAFAIYQYLSAQGLRVFFSNVCLERLGASEYKKVIDAALDSSRVLVAVGTTSTNLESEWVRYEWDSFYNDILSGLKPQGRVFSYVDGISPASLPRSLRYTQVIPHENGALERLCRFIKNSLGDREQDRLGPTAPADDRPGSERVCPRLGRWLRSQCWIGYDPSHFDPVVCREPPLDLIRQDLAWIHAAGFTGIVTFGSRGTFAEIPRLAKEMGLAVIMGVWDAGDEGEVARAIESADAADAFCIGHNGLRDDRYGFGDLQVSVRRIRERTAKPVSTSEEVRFYRNNPQLATLGDWLFPDAHLSLQAPTASGRVPDVGRQVKTFRALAGEMASLAQIHQRALAVKMLMYPWQGAAKASPDHQRRFFAAALDSLCSPEVGLHVSATSVVHSAFDAPWKQGGPFYPWDPFTGLLGEGGSPRPAVDEIVRRKWYAT